ncbi:MAG TPA: YlxR family protein, partial [Chthonomonadales bacterium]|nr:YlxR family protein [Chthonomonadales bacterium]
PAAGRLHCLAGAGPLAYPIIGTDKRMPQPRHTPIRTCVACRQTDLKRELLRVVRLPEGGVEYDARGKLSGRGAYVCRSVECVTAARKQKRFQRALKIADAPEALFAELLRIAEESPGASGRDLKEPMRVLSEEGTREECS